MGRVRGGQSVGVLVRVLGMVAVADVAVQVVQEVLELVLCLLSLKQLDGHIVLLRSDQAAKLAVDWIVTDVANLGSQSLRIRGRRQGSCSSPRYQ